MIEKESDVWEWLMLRNAMIERAVWDFEMLISEAPIPKTAGSLQSEMTVPAIRQFAKGTNTEIWLKKIERIYNEKFRPYATEHAQDIVKAWRKHMKLKTKYELEQDLKRYEYKCPMCGGALRPITICGKKCIGSTFCYLNILMPKKEKKKCTSSE